MTGDESRPPMRLLNLTPHEVTILSEAGTALTIAPGGPPTRVELSRGHLGSIEVDGTQVDLGWSSTNGRVIDLPAAESDQLIIVARLVAEHAPDRDDLVFPDDLVRNAAGVIEGCRRLSRLQDDPQQ